jgi:hypothetical protein
MNDIRELERLCITRNAVRKLRELCITRIAKTIEEGPFPKAYEGKDVKALKKFVIQYWVTRLPPKCQKELSHRRNFLGAPRRFTDFSCPFERYQIIGADQRRRREPNPDYTGGWDKDGNWSESRQLGS